MVAWPSQARCVAHYCLRGVRLLSIYEARQLSIGSTTKTSTFTCLVFSARLLEFLEKKQNLYYKAMPAGFEWEKMLGPPFPTDRALGFGIFLLLIAFDVQVISLGLSSRCVMIK